MNKVSKWLEEFLDLVPDEKDYREATIRSPSNEAYELPSLESTQENEDGSVSVKGESLPGYKDPYKVTGVGEGSIGPKNDPDGFSGNAYNQRENKQYPPEKPIKEDYAEYDNPDEAFKAAMDRYNDLFAEYNSSKDSNPSPYPIHLPNMTNNEEDPNKSTLEDRNERAKEVYDLYIAEGDTSPANKSDLEDFFMELPGKAKDVASKGWEGLKGLASGVGDAVNEYTDSSKVGIYDFDPYHAERYYMALLQIDPAMAEGYKDMYTKRKELEKDYAKIEATVNKDSTLDDIRATHNAYLNNLSTLYGQGAQEDDLRVVEAKKNIAYTRKLLSEKGMLPADESNILIDDNKDTSNLNDAKIEAKAAIDKAKDADKNGVIDNEKEIRSAIDDIASKYNINQKDPKWINTIEPLITAIKERIREDKEAGYRAAEEGRKNRAELDAKIDAKYPNLRKEIASSNSILRIIPEGDVGMSSSRNEAVKKLSRMASDEALAGSDFAQALGRDGFMTTLEGWANVTRNITDSEWNTLKNRLENAISAAKARRSSAVNDFSGADKALERIGTASNKPKAASTKYPQYKNAAGKKYIKESANSSWRPVK